MEFVQNNVFNEYVSKYKELSLKEKKELVEKEMQELLVALDKLNTKYGKKTPVLFNNEILDLKKENNTEADFVEAMFVYSHSIKELLASLMDV